MSKGKRVSLRLAALVCGLLAVGAAFAQSGDGGRSADASRSIVEQREIVRVAIDQNRGTDRAVVYADLVRFGPWDDRNYALTRADLALLSPNEGDVRAPIPAFYRVEMRRANPDLPTSGPAQYPRSALNGYLAKYTGYQINGVIYTRIRSVGTGYDILKTSGQPVDNSGEIPNFLGSEKRITTPAGAAESAIAINPANTNIVIAGTNGPGSGQKMWRSSDGGVTWGAPIALANTCCDPTVGWSPDGAIGYASALSTVVGSGTNVLFYRSSDLGASWVLTATLSNQHISDKEFLHVDMHASSPHKGNVYVAWHDNNVQKFARSTNGGVSFGSVLTLDSANQGIGSDITSDAAGNVYFFFPATSGGSNAKTIRVVKSTDGGATFGAGSTVSATQADFDFPIPSMETRRAFIYTSVDTDRSGGAFHNSIYASWTDTNTLENDDVATANHSVIRVAYSRNGGSSWTVTTPHPTADVSTVDRFNHWLAVDRTGRIFVMYYDTRHSSGRSGTDIYYSVSSNGGQTWSAGTRLTTVTSRNISDSFEWGDYNGMDMMINDIIAIYTDNRDESGGTAQSVDVYGIGGFAGSTGNVSPVANFNFAANALSVNFTDASSDSDGSIASRSWNFGDSTTSTATNPSKTYAAAGTYNVQLTVTDNLGATNAITKAVTVSAVNTPPVANFTFTTSGLTATFTDTSTDSNGTIASRSWNFGDSTTSTATNPSKTYAAAGTFNVQLTVTDNGGATHSVTKAVTVTALPGNVLQNGVAVSGLAAAQGVELRYTMVVPAGASALKFVIAGGTGDADLYVRFGTPPTTATYDCRPYLGGNAETCNIATAQAGTYHVMLRAYTAFSGVSLTGSYTTGTPQQSFFENQTDFTINDNATVDSPIAVVRTGNAPTTLSVSVTIYHTYQGDLKVDLVAPDGTLYNIHNRTGTGTDNIIKTMTINASSEVAQGTWKLRVADMATQDTGRIDKWSLQF